MNEASVPSGQEISGKGRIHFVAMLFTAVIVSVGVMANLPYQYVEVSGTWRGVAQTEEMSRQVSNEQMPVMAG